MVVDNCGDPRKVTTRLDKLDEKSHRTKRSRLFDRVSVVEVERSSQLNSSLSLVRPLFEGPIDIVGDVHGEIDALRSLMRWLGYNDDGEHPAGRRLVLLGDLIDRGPDSPAVVELVKRLVQSGRAQCVLGNHDLNILLGDKKHDNHWFFGEEWSLEGPGSPPTPAVLADNNIRQTVVDFFKSLPLVLERDDVRAVHACWDDSMVETARQSTDALELHRRYVDLINADLGDQSELDEIDRALEHQNRNPVKVLTSGKEHRISPPFEASGKLRHEERIRWWEECEADPFCVFGHYSSCGGQMSPSRRAFCADFAVAKRWRQRQEPSFTGRFQGRLAAVRFPELKVLFDDGECREISPNHP